jgi:prefoldin subunit 5
MAIKYLEERVNTLASVVSDHTDTIAALTERLAALEQPTT